MTESHSTTGTDINPLLDPVFQQLKSQGKEKFFASLYLMEIDWETTPLTVLGKLIEYEAVHKMESLEDLKVRLREDRKIFAFFHPEAPHEPLIFVQLAFTKGMADNIQRLLDVDRSPLSIRKADTLTFYSISNAQAELTGINFGHFLIQRVVAEIAEHYSHIKHFATLSPIPGFGAWLTDWLDQGDVAVMFDTQRALLADALQTNWQEDEATIEQIKPLLMRLCAHYLLHEKQAGKPLDPVANFHLFNGAMIAQIHWLADSSDKGMRQSLGMMVNYHYKPPKMDQYQADFLQSGKVVASKVIEDYL